MIPDATSARASQPATMARAFAWSRQHGPAAVAEALVNFAAPFLIYVATRRGFGDVAALMAASVPPVAWSIAEFVRRRRLDALSLLVLGGIALSLVAFFGGGGVRFLQLREQLVAAVIGFLFLGSAAIGKPLIYLLARARVRRRSGPEAQGFEALSTHPIFRRAMLVTTLAWAFGLIVESALACALVFWLPIATFLVVSPILGYGACGALTAWTFWYVARRVAAARAASE
ncbi:MAG: VC0807 family protein [Candidatus Binataceae bacterium]